MWKQALRNAERTHIPTALTRELVIGLMAFLTVVDLFAAQAILPSLVRHYRVSPAAMGFAVNACTMGMAASGLLVALLSQHIDWRRGILVSLILLAVPTALLAVAPGLAMFTVLRVLQGVFMASAFTLTLAYLGEEYRGCDAASAFAAYITGNVASNLFGRLISAGLAEHFGLAANFYAFALLNLAGAALVLVCVRRERSTASATSPPMAAWLSHLRNRQLQAGFVIGFCILFAFIGTFTYINFVLVSPPLSVSPMQLGLVYIVFLPSILTTPLAGRVVARWGTRAALGTGLGIAVASLPLLITSNLVAVLIGMILMGVGTFQAQATATGFINQTATGDRAAASGLYLAFYFLGGLIGSAILGQVFDRFGWTITVMLVGVALLIAVGLSFKLHMPSSA